MKKELVSRMGLKKRAGIFFAVALLSFILLPTLTAQPYPRIANLYGSGLAWMDPAEGLPYWSKLGMIVGGAGFHNDYEDKAMLSSAGQAARTAILLRETKPGIIILPYVNVLYGTKYENLPAGFWAKGADGNRVSPWPGYWSVDVARQDVLAHTAGFVTTAILANAAWDGVFLDCWAPDAFLVPAFRSSSKDRFIITNTGRLSSEVSPLVNGTMSEDELNDAASGSLNFSNLVDRYLSWCSESAKPALSIISCHPRSIDTDPWLWAKKTVSERQAILEKESQADLPMMRFGLCFTLLGDGFFAFDGGPQNRGSHWWYPEYDVPLGQPLANAVSIDPDVWERDFRGGRVIVNGSTYDESVVFPANMKDMSTGRVARDFVVPRIDGRIFVPTDEAGNGIPADRAIFSRNGSGGVVTEIFPDGRARWQFPNGLELYFRPDSFLSSIRWMGKTILRGGFPDIALKGWVPARARADSVNHAGRTSAVPVLPAESIPSGSGIFEWENWAVWLSDRAVQGDWLGDHTIVRLDADKDGSVRLAIRDSFEVLDSVPLDMWRYAFFFPIDVWKGRAGSCSIGEGSPPSVFTLPQEKTAGDLAGGKVITLEGEGFRLEIRSDRSFGLIDHRQWGTNDYLWASYQYPAPREPTKGDKFSSWQEIRIIPADNGR